MATTRTFFNETRHQRGTRTAEEMEPGEMVPLPTPEEEVVVMFQKALATLEQSDSKSSQWFKPAGKRKIAGDIEPSSEQKVDRWELSSDDLVAKFEDALRSLEQSHARISQLLGPSGQRRVTSDIEGRCLAVVEMEMSSIVASLKSCPLTFRDDDIFKDMPKWMQELDYLAKRILESTEPRRCRLLDQALEYFRCKNPNPYSLLQLAEEFLLKSEDPHRFLIEAEDRDRFRLHLRPMSTPSCDTDELLTPPTPAVQADDLPLVGIDRPIKYLLRWLAPGSKKAKRLSAMLIVGPIGIGKTTLAIELYNRLIKCQADGGPYYFHFKFMARLSKGHDGTMLLLRDILSQISDQAGTDELRDWISKGTKDLKISQLCSFISTLLRNKRYFICIDDIMETREWEKIKDAFPNNSLNSRVLITSRIRSTALSCFSYYSMGFMHEIKPLNRVDSERLLILRAFGSPDAVLPDRMKLQIDKILMRCDGVPLLINGMADWLKEKFPFPGHEIHEEELDAQVPKQLESALCSAYEDFPYYLKILSLYVSILPYGYKFDNHRLFSMFPRHGYDKRAFFLSKLVDMNIITRVAGMCKSDPDEDEWHVNHFMHHFLSAKNSGLAVTSDMLRDLKAISTLLAGEILYFSETRLLTLSGAVSEIPFRMFINLLELDLEGWKNLTDENLQQVCKSKMFFLQCLSVRNTGVTKLPHEIKGLCNLKMLDISYTEINELPLEVFKIKFLYYLDLRGTRIRQLPKQIEWKRRSITPLLFGEEGTLSSVQKTRVSNSGVVYLRNLQILATIDLSEQSASFVYGLGDLSGLRVLAITWSFHQCSDQDYRAALLSSIEKWYCLESLTINCGLGCTMEFLGSLSNPPKKLEKLKVIAGRLASVPKWISVLERLSFVQITICKQRTEDLKVLGGLRRLQCLILGLDFIPLEAVLIEREGFPELERFTVDCPNQWLSFSIGAMRKLRYLQLKFCAIPAYSWNARDRDRVPSGIGCLQSITEVALCYSIIYVQCPSVKNTVAAVREQVAIHLNPIDLFINGIQDYDAQAAVDEVPGTEDSAQPVDEEVVVKATTTKQIQSTSEIEDVKNDA